MAKLIITYFILMSLLACMPSYCQMNSNLDYDILVIENMAGEDTFHELQRSKRAAEIIENPFLEYVIYIEIPAEILADVKGMLNSVIFPITLTIPGDPDVNITSFELTAECTVTEFDTECVCEEGYIWDRWMCNMYGSCLNTTGEDCSCIRSLPYNGTCEPWTANTTSPPIPPSPPDNFSSYIDYEIYIEVPTALLNDMKAVLKDDEPLQVLNIPTDIRANLTSLTMTAVCTLTDSDTECVCEEEGYIWDSQLCNMYGSCLNITGGDCSCIKAIPSNVSCVPLIGTTTPSATSVSPTTQGPTINASIEYIISIETPDVLLNDLSNSFSEVTSLVLNTSADITANLTSLKMTTVCRLQDNDTQCTCERGYKWNIQTCNTYQSCSNAVEDKCNCLKYSLGNESCEPSTESPTTAVTTTLQTVSFTVTAPNNTEYSTTAVTLTTSLPPITETTPASTTDFYQTSEASTSTTVSSVSSNPTTHLSTATSFMTTSNLTPAALNSTAVTTVLSSMSTSTTASTQTAASSSTSTSTIPASTSPTTPLSSASMPTTVLQTATYLLNIAINQEWSQDYENSSSAPYIRLKSNMENALFETYRNESGYKETRVVGFRKGSVIVDSIVKMGDTTREVMSNTAAALTAKLQDTYNYTVISVSSTKEEIATTVLTTLSSPSPKPGKVTISPSTVIISVESTLSLTCIVDSGASVDTLDVKWYLNDYEINNTIPNSLEFQRTVQNTWEGGQYSCELLVDGVRKRSSSATVTVYSLPSDIIIYASPFLCSTTNEPTSTDVKCCISSGDKTEYAVQLRTQMQLLSGNLRNENGKYCFVFSYTPPDCKNQTVFCVYQNPANGTKEIGATVYSIKAINKSCSDPYAIEHQEIQWPCDGDQIGNLTKTCIHSKWSITSSTCVAAALRNIRDLLLNLNNSVPLEIVIPNAIQNLLEATQQSTTNITTDNNIEEVVTILQLVSKSNIPVNKTTVNNFMTAVDAIIGSNSSSAWATLNKKQSNASLQLLTSVENFTTLLTTNEQNFTINTTNVQLYGINISDANTHESFRRTFYEQNTVEILPAILNALPESTLLLSIGFKSLAEFLHLNSTNTSKNAVINGIIMVTSAKNNNISNISMTFYKKNSSLDVPNCVFVNKGEWSTAGCKGSNTNDTVICTCNHNTAFSILMSSSSEIDHDEKLEAFLEWITYIGVGISIGSLVLCLLIEAMVWQPVVKSKQAYMKHLCIVNIALSLLIADIWFIVAADKNLSKSACKAATFFIHFFYLSLFFWMLIKGLVLLYITVKIFLRISQATILAISLPVGYGCPLIISSITVAVTEPQNSYIGNESCWLNWKESKALLAFVVPALVIIAVNAVILLVVILVIIRVLQPTIGQKAKDEDRNIILQIAKTVGLLTPFLGLTWGFGLGITITPSSNALRVIFTVLNAFQGFFILVLGTIMDDKVRKALLRKLSLSKWTSQRTTTTRVFSVSSGGPVSRAFNKFYKKSRSAPRSESGADYATFSSM